MNAISPTAAWTWILGWAALLACVVPSQLAYSISPSSTFFNQATAVVGWGVFLSLVLHRFHRPVRLPAAQGSGAWALNAALWLLALSAVGGYLFRDLPLSMALASASMLLAALLVSQVAMLVAQADARGSVFRVLTWGMVVAGLIGVGVGVVQVFAPAWTEGQWLATSALPGRATGNIRQPNHLGTLLLWALVSVVVVFDWPPSGGAATSHGKQSGASPSRAGLGALTWLFGLLLVLGVVLSASRTAALGLLVLAAWGALDSRLSVRSRALLMSTPILYAVLWFALTQWADATGHAFGGAARFTVQGDVSSSRFGIWSNTLSLIAQQPWVGVGWGNFNFAWSLTPFPGRPTAFFDHSHNLFLQLMVELGVPLATLIVALLGWAFWKAAGAAWRAAPGLAGLAQRSSMVMLLLMALHSQLEYPLWYAYFLLPTAFLWGLCLGHAGCGAATSIPNAASQGPWRLGALHGGVLLMALAGTLAMWDYWRVAVIFSPPAGAAPLADRIAYGQRSWLFSHFAHYAGATTADPPQKAMASFDITTHQLLDTRLMVAWAKALNAQGDVDRARHLAARLREFRNPKSESFFAPCAQTAQPAPLPFQCTAPEKSMDWTAFR